MTGNSPQYYAAYKQKDSGKAIIHILEEESDRVKTTVEYDISDIPSDLDPGDYTQIKLTNEKGENVTFKPRKFEKSQVYFLPFDECFSKSKISHWEDKTKLQDQQKDSEVEDELDPTDNNAVDEWGDWGNE
ncbi:hypothetical protein [Natrinema altunense]|uniref:Uncharacterized protein n=1 Tax=Natrinema altunense TaxID=222984 RepID=A0A482Y3K6_9EURY|nr:hypothetical protein [Natrinema altunense]RZH69460.1 hypothetical protein ELS17_08595 [Natrinema altunense]